MTIQVITGDCLEIMPTLESDSFHAVVTDPPYGLKFMGKSWDHGIPGRAYWVECMRVARPGAHLLAFGGTRTFHRLACAIEDAGWEIRDCIMWVYGSGFPKSLDVSKAIDKAAGAERADLGVSPNWRESKRNREKHGRMEVRGENAGRITESATDAAREWQGWGTALKPAWEPIIVARKPLIGTVAENVQKYGTGPINVDGCRVGFEGGTTRGENGSNAGKSRNTLHGDNFGISPINAGRWPSNVIHDGSYEVMELFPVTTSGKPCGVRNTEGGYGGKYGSIPVTGVGDSGSAARFFYCAKASRSDRNEGCEDMEKRPLNWSSGTQSPGTFQTEGTDKTAHNHHPTVKPTSLMRYLCRLVTPPGGSILDPFAGSGSTGKAARLEGFDCTLIELNPDYSAIAEARSK